MTDRNRAGISGNNSSGQGASSSSGGMTHDVRQRAIDAYDSARETASSAGRRATDTIEQAPLMALGAGIAAGAVLAALLPTSRRERELLRPYGDRVTGAARDAANAARETGSQKLRELGLTPDALANKATEAAKATAQAAAGTFREEATTESSEAPAKPPKRPRAR